MKDKKIVPREATEAMIKAGDMQADCEVIWRAMYDAAPSTKRQSSKEIIEQAAKDYERTLKSLATK